MVRRWIFVLCALAVRGVDAADDLSDFSNNLATDIGPLLVLVGESMTKQYLSESTSFIDYFIFAMAPIGIITAIVSTIRVCGHSSLRAFIGRAQEGDGVVEAELCTSTSRDVCELFNRGGITRVLGRPSILELVYLPDDGSLHLFRNYLKTQDDLSRRPSETLEASPDLEDQEGPKTPEVQSELEGQQALSRSWWRREGVSWLEKAGFWPRPADGGPGEGRPNDLRFAPHPNLSLNVGIVKRSRPVFYAIAAIGLVLQAGVLVLAGTGVWILGWNLNGAKSSASRDYAPAMFIAGTILMCGGMWSCAALIGQTTQELRFERTKRDAEQPRLLWLQPGPQLIGDQSFDPFAFFEKPANPLQVWTSSTKDLNEKFEIYSFSAVLAVVVGYVMQFIGLRGMRAWVSLYQLGATLVMSILRGCLRMQRLGRQDNSLRNMLDMVAGHELDWLSFAIVGGEPGEGRGDEKGSHRQESTRKQGVKEEGMGPSWHVLSRAEGPGYLETQGSGPSDGSRPCGRSSETQLNLQSSGDAQPAPPQSPDGTRRGLCEELLSIRKQLAHITGHTAFGKELGDQRWEDSKVKVREKAVAVSNAVCQAAGDLWKRRRLKKNSEDIPQSDITLRIRAVASSDFKQTTSDEQSIGIILKPPNKSQLGWRIDSAQLEAILGLWIWTMVSDERVVESEDDSNQKRSRAGGVQCGRIISAGPAGKDWDRETNIQGEMDLWLGSNAVTLLDDNLILSRKSCHGIASLWPIAPGDKNYWELLPGDSKYNASQKPKWRRFCGWKSIYTSLARSAASDATTLSGQEENQPVQLRVQLTPTSGSLLDVCAQELFTSLMTSLTTVLTAERTAVVENAGLMQLENPTVTASAKAFVECGLGSNSDALLCLAPAFRSQLSFTSSEAMLSSLLKAAETYRKASEWDRAQNILRSACTRHALPCGEEDQSALTSNDRAAFARALRATGELYRWSFANLYNNERKRFGKDGIEWMKKKYGSVDDLDVTKILSIYQGIDSRFPEDSTDEHLPQDDAGRTRTYSLLVEALRDYKREEALYRLCFINRDDFGSKELQAALPLAVRNDWSEVVGAMLEMRASPNSQDVNGRTSISYCAEFGHEAYVKQLIDLGAFLDQPDNEKRTPLHISARFGQQNVSKLLLDTGHVNVEATDQLERTPLHEASWEGHHAIAQLLLEKGANFAATDKSGRAPLHGAADGGHEAVIQLLLEKGADIQAIETERGRTPLHGAADGGHEAVVQLLLENGAEVKAEDQDERTPLHGAADTGHEAVVRLLLKKGAEVKATDKSGRAPLHGAADRGHEAVVQLLLENGAEVKAEDLHGWTPLHGAANRGHEAVVRLLLEKGAEAKAKDFSGWTPLHEAARNGHEAVVRLLLEHGADIQAIETKHGRTPLHLAAGEKNTAMVKMLIEKGAEIEATDKDWQTPLHAAAENGNEAIVQLLLEKGSDVELRDKHGRTPRDSAAEWRQEAIVRLLTENMEARMS